MAKQASIQLKNLTKEYVTHEGTGTFLAVDHINVDIASGQFRIHFSVHGGKSRCSGAATTDESAVQGISDKQEGEFENGKTG